jgi:predicted esterase
MALHAQAKPVVWHLDAGAGHTITPEGLQRAKTWLTASLT